MRTICVQNIQQLLLGRLKILENNIKLNFLKNELQGFKLDCNASGSYSMINCGGSSHISSPFLKHRTLHSSYILPCTNNGIFTANNLVQTITLVAFTDKDSGMTINLYAKCTEILHVFPQMLHRNAGYKLKFHQDRFLSRTFQLITHHHLINSC